MSIASKIAARFTELSEKRSKDLLTSLEESGIKVSDGVRNERYDVCLKCDKLYLPTKTCKVCGCLMQVKTYMPSQSCPIGKWGPIVKDSGK